MVAKDTTGSAPSALSKVDVKAAREALKKLKKDYEAACKPYRAAILKAKLKEINASE